VHEHARRRAARAAQAQEVGAAAPRLQAQVEVAPAEPPNAAAWCPREAAGCAESVLAAGAPCVCSAAP
jgi:hypothetical protein